MSKTIYLLVGGAEYEGYDVIAAYDTKGAALRAMDAIVDGLSAGYVPYSAQMIRQGRTPSTVAGYCNRGPGYSGADYYEVTAAAYHEEEA